MSSIVPVPVPVKTSLYSSLPKTKPMDSFVSGALPAVSEKMRQALQSGNVTVLQAPDSGLPDMMQPCKPFWIKAPNHSWCHVRRIFEGAIVANSADVLAAMCVPGAMLNVSNGQKYDFSFEIFSFTDNLRVYDVLCKQYGFNVHAHDCHGQLLLNYVPISVIKPLITEYGVKLDMQTSRGTTALGEAAFQAARSSDLTRVRWLQKLGAKLSDNDLKAECSMLM